MCLSLGGRWKPGVDISNPWWVTYNIKSINIFYSRDEPIIVSLLLGTFSQFGSCIEVWEILGENS